MLITCAIQNIQYYDVILESMNFNIVPECGIHDSKIYNWDPNLIME